MRGGDLTRLLIIGVLVCACNCSKEERDVAGNGKTASQQAKGKAAGLTTPGPDQTPSANDPVPATAADIADLTDEDDGDAGTLIVSHTTSGTKVTIPESCEHTIHTERVRLFDCPGWTMRLSWVATQAVPTDLVAAAKSAPVKSKRTVVSATPTGKGIVLLTDRADGFRGFEGWLHLKGKLVYLQAQAPRSTFASLEETMKRVATDFVVRNSGSTKNR